MSEFVNKKAEIDAKNKKKDEANQKLNRTLPKVETKMEDKGGKAIPSTSGSKYPSQVKEEKKENRELSKQRIRVEHIFRKLKIFRILREKYRNKRKRFCLRFNLIAACCNLAIRSA